MVLMQRLTSAEGWVGSQLLELRREVCGLLRQPLETTPIPSKLGKCGRCGGDEHKRDNFKSATIRLMAKVTERR